MVDPRWKKFLQGGGAAQFSVWNSADRAVLVPGEAADRLWGEDIGGDAVVVSV